MSKKRDARRGGREKERSQSEDEGGRKKKQETHSGRSLMNPNLVNNLTRRPFSSSRMSSRSIVSSAL
jgi:hypothetical protein